VKKISSNLTKLELDEQLELIKKSKMKFYKKVFIGDFNKSMNEKEKLLETNKRLTIPLHKNHMEFELVCNNETIPEIAASKSFKRLGLTKLRKFGNGQDKIHHITADKNFDKFKRK
jgi:hypothetical protein